MADALKRLYDLLPPTLQSAGISLYGAALYRKRYGAPFQRILSGIEEVERLSPGDVQQLRLRKLKEMLVYAQNHIPYYQDLFSRIAFNPREVTEIKALEQIPPLEKEELRRRPEDFKATRSNAAYFTQKTSGSSGTPLEVEVDEATYKMAMALLVDHERRCGVSFRDRRATFAGRMLKPAGDYTPPFCRYNHAERQLLLSAYHINSHTASDYVSALNRFNPKEIIGYPSAIYSLAFEIAKLGLRVSFKPAAVITNSETLHDWQRETIEEVFGCRVFDYYGTAEYVVFARQCERGAYHVNSLFGILEVVDGAGHQVVGEEGDVLCTTLVNRRMPLIRYRIGDRAVASDQVCCNDQLGVVEKFVGRVDDYVVTPDGMRIGRLDHIYKGLQNIREAQIVQHTPAECVVRVVRATPDAEIDESRLRENFLERVGATVNMRIEYVSGIERSRNGKFRGVVSNVGRAVEDSTN